MAQLSELDPSSWTINAEKPPTYQTGLTQNLTRHDCTGKTPNRSYKRVITDISQELQQPSEYMSIPDLMQATHQSQEPRKQDSQLPKVRALAFPSPPNLPTNLLGAAPLTQDMQQSGGNNKAQKQGRGPKPTVATS
jgi:hypothetical protein